MKTILLILVFVFAIFSSCSNDATTSNGAHDFVKTLEGTIGKHDIMMKLTSNSGEISGSYFYKSQMQKMELKGKLDAQGAITINEFNDKGSMTGIFTGKMSGENKMEGNWAKPNGDSPLPFVLLLSNSDYDAQLAAASQHSDYSHFKGTYSFHWENKSIGEGFDDPNSGGNALTIEGIEGNEFTYCLSIYEGYHACDETLKGKGTFQSNTEATFEYSDIYAEAETSSKAYIKWTKDSIVVSEFSFIGCPAGFFNDVLFPVEYFKCREREY